MKALFYSGVKMLIIKYFCGQLEFLPKEPCEVRELDHNLPEKKGYEKIFGLFYKILSQKRNSRDEICSLHEPEYNTPARAGNTRSETSVKI